MRTAVILLAAAALSACATIPVTPAPFERCMATLKGVDYTGDNIKRAEWCVQHDNGGIR